VHRAGDNVDLAIKRRVEAFRFVIIWATALLAITLQTGAHAAAALSDRVRIAENARSVAEFSLLDQDGKPFTQDQLRGGTSLVFFGFTHCRNVCPATMQVLRSVSRTIDDERLTTVFVSVDGDRDTPSVVRSFLQPFMPGFVGLTGSPQAVRRLADGFSAVFFKGMQTGDGGYDVEHTSQVYLVDRQGRIRASFYNAPESDIASVTRSVMGESSGAGAPATAGRTP
jgi:protein SCO1/2